MLSGDKRSILDGPAVICALLIKLQIVTDAVNKGKWPVFKDQLPGDPTDPANAVAVYRVEYRIEGRIQRTGESIRKHGIQIRLRAGSNPEAQSKGLEIEAALDRIQNEKVTIGGERFNIQGIHQTMSMAPMGLDANKRFNYSLNYTATITRIN